MQLTYTLDDLQEDIKRFVKEGRVDLDGLLTDSMDTGTVTEDPVPTFEPGRSLTKEIFPSSFNRLNISPQTQCRDNHSSMASYGGISSVIQQLSNCSTGHKSDIRYAFRATAGSQRAPANYNIPGPTTICEDMVQDSKSTLYKVPGDEMMQNSEAALYQALANFIFPQGNISFLPADHIMWNLFDHAVAMDRSFTRIPFTGITTVLTRAIRDPFSTQHSTDCLEDLKSNDGMDRFGSTLLHLAAVNGGNFTILNTLITNANINRVNSLGETFMHVVQPRAIGDEMPILTQTLEGLNFPFTQRDHKGRTCIHVLLGNGAYLEHLASYAHLLKITNAEWDRRLIPDEDPWGFRDLISNGREDLQPGWEELQRNSCKCHSWHTCRAYRELDVDEYYCNGEPELMKACWKNDPSLSQDYYEDLIAEGANVHYRNWNRETPLLLAVMTGNVKATRVLLRHRSNVHARIGRSGILRWASWWRRKFVGSECYANIIACEALVIDAGAVMFPTMFDEWDFKADHF